MWRTATIARCAVALGAALVVLATVAPGRAGPDCKCRYFGKFYALGESICIRGRVATCDLVLNNSSWRFTDRACRPVAEVKGTSLATKPPRTPRHTSQPGSQPK